MDTRLSGGIGGAAQGASVGFSVGGGVGAVIGGVAGGLAGVFGGGAEDEIQAMIDAQLDALRAQTKEQVRQQRFEMKQTLGQATAAIGASGVQFDGTSTLYRDKIEQEYRRTMSWTNYAARLQEEVIKTGGQMAQDQIQRGGMGQLIQGVTSLGMVGAKAGWFGGGAPGGSPNASGSYMSSTGGLGPKMTPAYTKMSSVVK